MHRISSHVFGVIGVRAPRLLLVGTALVCCAAPSFAEETKKPKDDRPRITIVAPLAVTPGSKVDLKLVGTKLDGATEVLVGSSVTEPPATQPAQSQPAETQPAATQPTTEPSPATQPSGPRVTIKKTGKAPSVMGEEGTKAGDVLIEAELQIPADQAPGELPLAVVTPAGRSEPAHLLVLAPGSLADDKPARNAFRDAEPIEFGKTIRGVIASGNAVDVYRFEAKAGQKITAEVTARRRHSLLDSLIALYDAQGHLLAENDDADGIAPDSLLNQSIASDGTYYLTITDANGRGGPQFPYLLKIATD